MREYVFVGLGGMIGSVARFAISSWLATHMQSGFPLGTFFVNVTGCFVIGVVYGSVERTLIDSDMRLFLISGLCGGFTTFSAFSAESLFLFRSGNVMTAGLYCVLSVIVGVAATYAGLMLMRLTTTPS